MRRFGWTFVISFLPAVVAACGPGGAKSSPSATAAASVAPVVVATVAPAPSPTLAPTIEAAAYTVKAGDTLSRIASENKTSVDAIVKANDLADPDKLQVGQKLAIPPAAGGASAAPPASGSAGALPPAASKPPPP